MRKLYAILVTLLFVTSVFGVASITADLGYSCDDYYRISRTSAHVGDIFTMSLHREATSDVKIDSETIGDINDEIEAKGGLPYQIGPLELINVEYFKEDWTLIHSGFVKQSEMGPEFSELVWIRWTFRGVQPDTVILTNDECKDTVTITISPKSTPMNFFMKIIGFGKKK